MNKIYIFFGLVLLVSCAPNEVPSKNIVERNGIKYEVNSQTSFTGISVSSYKDGQLESKETYKNGQLHGLYESYYENGQLQYKRNYKYEKRDGLTESYYENGQLFLKGNFIDGKEDGIWQTYHENGQLESKGNFIDGKEDGVWDRYDILGLTEHYKNGELQSKGNFIDGKEEGAWEIYDDYPPSKGNFIDGKKDGVWTSYLEDGQVWTTTYKKGLYHGLNNYYAPDGTLLMSLNYKDNKQDGFQEYYFDGIRSERCWKNGVDYSTDLSPCKK